MDLKYNFINCFLVNLRSVILFTSFESTLKNLNFLLGIGTNSFFRCVYGLNSLNGWSR